jgi:large subunit ribosomal protein L5
MAETKTQKVNTMTKPFIEKVTVNICVGNDKQGMDKAEKLLKKLTDRTPVKNTAKRRLATWQIRPGLPIGFKVTLRDEEAAKFLKWMFESKENTIKANSFDQYGNFSMGFPEYLELNGIKYDADIGIMGFEFTVSFAKPGFRIKKRLLQNKKVPQRHRVKKEEAIEHIKEHFGVKVE